ncbi:MAG: TonB-dependent receptor [Rhodospirillales bacterium]|nr:TonB-dependent receptor [Rhodospirillales bacterium]
MATVWRFSGSGNAHASVSAKSRFPTIKDRYSYRMGTAIPNSDLKAERAINYEIGVSEQFWGHTRFEATAFHSDLSDIIQSVTLSPSLTQMRNVGDGHSRGLELGARSLALKNTELGAAYTFLDRANTSNGAVKLTDTPRHKLFAYAKYDATERVSLTPGAEWASSRYVTTQGRKTDGFVVANFKAAWQITDTFGAEAGINNLFDRNYELADGFPEEGRNYFLNARVKF